MIGVTIKIYIYNMTLRYKVYNSIITKLLGS